MNCQRVALLPILSAVRKIILLIQIIVPILLIIWAIFGFVQLMHNPEQQNGVKKIFNRFIAAVIVFMIPFIVNMVMGLLGDSTSFSSCWKDAKDFKVTGSGYNEIDTNKKKQKIVKEYTK